MSIALTWPVPNASEQDQYSVTEIYKGSSEEGPFSLVDSIPINETVWVDASGGVEDWYRLRYLEEESGEASDFTEPLQGLVTGSYCLAEDVLELLAAYDLTTLGTPEEIETTLNGIIGRTKPTVDRECNRDFELHYLERHTVDGSGNPRLMLEQHPVVFVRSIEGSGLGLGAEDLAVDGAIGLIKWPEGYFPMGFANLEVTVTWGWALPPEDIVYAHAKLVAAEVLMRMQGTAGGAESVQLGDYSVRYTGGGQYATDISNLLTAARRTFELYRSPALVW